MVKGIICLFIVLVNGTFQREKWKKVKKMREAAVREVEEECGITVNYLGRKIETTYHTYIMRGKFMLKQTNWYEMGVNKVPKLVPQLEEDITEARWIGKDELNLVKENTYPMIAEIIKKNQVSSKVV